MWSTIKKYKVEPLLFFYMIGVNVSLVCYTKLIQDKVCSVDYGFDEDFCRNLHEPQYAKTDAGIMVLSRATTLNMISTVISSVPTFFAILFVGPWLDKFNIGPKIVLSTTLLFGMIESMLNLTNTFFLNLGPWWLVWSKLPNGLTGAMMLTYTCVFTYAMKETPASERTARLNVLEAAIILPSPISYMSSSFIMDTTPWIVPGQTLNYVAIFSTSLLFYTFAFFWAILVLRRVKPINEMQQVTESRRLSICNAMPTFDGELLKEPTDLKLPEVIEESLNSVIDGKINESYEGEDVVDGGDSYQVQFERDNVNSDQLTKHTSANTQTQVNGSALNNHYSPPPSPPSSFNDDPVKTSKSSQKNLSRSVSFAPDVSLATTATIENPKPWQPLDKDSNDWRVLINELLKLDNIYNIIIISWKKREHNGRARLFAVYILYTLIIIITLGCTVIMVPFVESMYGWSASYYQYVDGFGKLVLSLMSTGVLHFLSQVGKVPDTKIIMLGICCAFFNNAFRAAFHDPRGLYFSYGFGCVLLAGLVGCRAVVSKLVPVSEQGAVMSAMSAIYSLSPMIGAFIYAHLFDISLTGYPGLPFAGGAALSVLAMVVLCWLDYSMKFH